MMRQNNKLPEKLTMLRKYHGYSQGDIAGKLGVTVQEYMNFENGNKICSIEQLRELANLYHINVMILLDNTKTIVIPDSNAVDDSVTIPFQNRGYNMNDTLDVADNMLPVDGVLPPSSEDEPTAELGATRVMDTAEFAETEITDTVNDDDDEETEERPVSKPHKKSFDRKKRKTIIIASACAAAVVVILVILLVLNGSGSSVSLSSLNRLAVGDTYSMYIDNNGKLKTRGNVSGTSDFTNLVQVSAFDAHVMGLTADGTVVTNDGADVSDWTNVIMIAAGEDHSAALKKDGTVLCTGDDEACAVDDWTDIDAVYAGDGITIGHKNDGSLEVAGSNIPSALADEDSVQMVACGQNEIVVVNTAGTVTTYSPGSAVADTSSWNSIQSAAAGSSIAVGLTDKGTVSAATSDEDMKNTIEGWTSIRYIAANGNTVIAIDRSGNMHGAGDNTYNQYEEDESEATATPDSDQLETPSGITFTPTTANIVIKWNTVSHADYYEVTVSTDPQTTAKTTSNSTSIAASLLTNDETYVVTVTAYSDDESKYKASETASVNYTYSAKTIQLDTPSNIQQSVSENGWTFTWDAVSHADYYEVVFNNENAEQVSDASFTASVDGLSNGATYAITITACSEGSTYTASQQYQGQFIYHATTYNVTIHYTLSGESEDKTVVAEVPAGTYRISDLLSYTDLAGYTPSPDSEVSISSNYEIEMGIVLTPPAS